MQEFALPSNSPELTTTTTTTASLSLNAAVPSDESPAVQNPSLQGRGKTVLAIPRCETADFIAVESTSP